jgi:hypothetical protein
MGRLEMIFEKDILMYIMKRFLLLLLFVSSLGFAQSSGITYQAVIYNPNGRN